MHPYFVPDVLQGNVMVEADVLTAAIQILLWSKQNGCDACAQAVADVRRSAFCVPLRLPRLKGCVELVLHQDPMHGTVHLNGELDVGLTTCGAYGMRDFDQACVRIKTDTRKKPAGKSIAGR